tara:strand:+ start:707 stop:1690 length:984 start_codon:yes stop_codon:yes gene_type:complete
VVRDKNNIIGFTLIEILIGVVISAIMMGAMFTTYSVVSNSYSQVSDVAGISRSGRDIVTLMMRDIRLAGFKYHYGVFPNADPAYPKRDYLEFVAGDTEETRKDSHAPIVIYKNTLNYAEINPEFDYTGSYVDVDENVKHNQDDFCCDRIHIVYGDFKETDVNQPYKRYRITYYAVPMQRSSSKQYGANEEDPTKYYGLYRSKESWIQELDDDTGGSWVSDSESGDCPDCYRGELVREYLEDMEFIALNKDGLMVEAQPSNMENIMSIRTVDFKLTFRSSTQKGYFKNKINRVVKSFTDERTKEINTKFHRDTIFITVHTRNIGGGDI